MNEDTNKELEQNQTVSNESVVTTPTNINETGVVEEVSFNYPEKEEVVEEKVENKVEEAGTVVDAPVVSNNVTSLEEVSVSGESSLEVTEVSDNSVFNQKSEVEPTTGAMKEGLEKSTAKKGFPYGMVIGFVILIICAFFIDYIVGFVEDIVMNKDGTLIEEKKKEDNQEMQEEKKENSNQETSS